MLRTAMKGAHSRPATRIAAEHVLETVEELSRAGVDARLTTGAPTRSSAKETQDPDTSAC
jgi:hypothetical protein